MTFRYANEGASAMLTALSSFLDAGNTLSLVIYNGTIPSTLGAAVTTQTPLATFTFSDPSFGAPAAVTGGVAMVAAAIAAVEASATGTATWFRILKDTTTIAEGDVTDTNGTGALKVSSTSILEGIDVSIVSLSMILPTS